MKKGRYAKISSIGGLVESLTKDGMQISFCKVNYLKMIIIKYYEWLRFAKDVRETVWEVCNSKYKKIRQVSKEEALRLIRENNLHMVYKSSKGAIYEQ